MRQYSSSGAQERANLKIRRSWRLAAAFSQGRWYPRTPALKTGNLIVVDFLNSQIHDERRRQS
jgi:hypothetical protein